MLKRLVVLGIAGAFLAAPPAIAKSSSAVKQAPAKAKVGGHGDGQCPNDAAAAAL